MTGEYGTAYRHSLDSPDAFWAEAAEAIEWDRKWDKVLDDSNAPFYRWFSGGVLNTLIHPH
jgi:propionyl-CoA synthetase